MANDSPLPAAQKKVEPIRTNADGSIALPAAKIRTPEQVPDKLYELRALATSPTQTIHVPLPKSGRVACFTAYRGLPMMTAEGRFSGPVQGGGLQRFTDAELQEILDGIENLVVLERPNGTGGIYASDSPHLRGASDVTPLANHVSLRPVSEVEVSPPQPMSLAGRLVK